MCVGLRTTDQLRCTGLIWEHDVSRSRGTVCTSPWDETQCSSQLLHDAMPGSPTYE